MARVEILHVRNPDDGCDVIVFIDGHLSVDFAYADVDPGRGYTVEDWDESSEWDTSLDRGHSDAFNRAIADAYASGRDSEYVMED